MPKYDFECRSCNEKFDMKMSIKERGAIDLKCVECGSSDVAQIFTGIGIISGSGKEPSAPGCCSPSSCSRFDECRKEM